MSSGATQCDLQPAALVGDQNRLGAIDCSELAVDVVQVSAYGARGKCQLVGDLLVDLAFGQPLQHTKLPSGEWAGVDVALALAGRAWQLIHHPAELLGTKPD